MTSSVDVRTASLSSVPPTSERVQLVDDIHDVELVERVYEVFKATPVPNNLFWVSTTLVNRHIAGSRDVVEMFDEYYPPPVGEFVMRHLARLVERIQGLDSDPPEGFEIWARLFRPNYPGMYLHYDCDQVSKESGDILTPRWGTIFYVGPKSGIPGGETIINTELPIPDSVRRHITHTRTIAELQDESPAWMTVSPRFNRLVVFHGSLIHGVAPIGDARDIRVSFLVNVWNHVITPFKNMNLKGISLLKAEHFRLLTRLPYAQAVQLDRVRDALSPKEYVDLVRAITELPGILYDRRY